MGTRVTMAPTPNISKPLSWKVSTRFLPAEVPTSARKRSKPNCLSSWLEAPDMVHSTGPVLPTAPRIKATMSTPPVRPGENEKLSEKEMDNLPKSTPRTIPMAMGKKSVSETFLASLPKSLVTSSKSSFSPATISLSPNFSTRLGEGAMSIPLRRTRVTVQL